jgi:FkbM family methyltransferase
MHDSFDEVSPKRLALRMYDLNLFGTAQHYDLRERAERSRSASDLARFFFRVVRACQPSLFIDAGAKDAGSSRRARRYLQTARIVAFEANPYTYKRFSSISKPEHRVEYVHLALSDNDGLVTFNVRKSAEGTPIADGRGSLLRRRDEEHGHEEVTVPAATLDKFFSDFPFDSCALWIDVEGACGAVLRGGNNVLGKASVALVEVEDREFWEQSWKMPDVASFLYDRGMVAIARDFQSRYQYNVVFVRDSLLHNDEFRFLLTQYRSAASNRPQVVQPAGRVHHARESWHAAAKRLRRLPRKVFRGK